jgi:hypothetical protein
MKVPWHHDRCIACGISAILTEEHLIPQSLAGRLTVDFLCKSCNDDLGHRIEAQAKKDPAIVLAIRNFESSHPERARRLADGMDLIVYSEGGSSRARRRGNDIRVKAHQLPDGSLVQPTDDARRSFRCQATVENVPICDTKSVPPVLVDNCPMPPVIVAARIAPTLSIRPPAALPQAPYAQGMGRAAIACTEALSAPIPVRVVLATAIPLLTPPPLFGPGRPYPGAGSSGL